MPPTGGPVRALPARADSTGADAPQMKDQRTMYGHTVGAYHRVNLPGAGSPAAPGSDPGASPYGGPPQGTSPGQRAAAPPMAPPKGPNGAMLPPPSPANAAKLPPGPTPPPQGMKLEHSSPMIAPGAPPGSAGGGGGSGIKAPSPSPQQILEAARQQQPPPPPPPPSAINMNGMMEFGPPFADFHTSVIGSLDVDQELPDFSFLTNAQGDLAPDLMFDRDFSHWMNPMEEESPLMK
jgi:hypothetical protein